ncbi:hypothetical protein [Xanthomonas campestris]|uniref:hypothetical protein n=1 Tax=Xanthomonas campestris TaxID=339 RepID=UPI0012904AF2|nr:hypothetical protein [Xanthomonas campestris]
MADEIPLAYDKTTGGTPVGLKEVAPGNQLGYQWLGQPPSYIDGMLMEWVSGSSVRVTTGACAIPGVGTVFFSTAITKAGLVLGASTYYHLYAYLNSGSPDFEISSTAPSAPYSGTARTKNGDTSRRYIGTIKTDASNAVIGFMHSSNNAIKYTNNVINNLVLSSGAATTATTVDASIFCPVTARLVDALCYNSSTTAFLFVSNSEAIPLTTSAYLAACSPASYLAFDLLLDSLQRFTYLMNAASGGGAFVRVMGYKFSR